HAFLGVGALILLCFIAALFLSRTAGHAWLYFYAAGFNLALPLLVFYRRFSFCTGNGWNSFLTSLVFFATATLGAIALAVWAPDSLRIGAAIQGGCLLIALFVATVRIAPIISQQGFSRNKLLKLSRLHFPYFFWFLPSSLFF